MPSLSVYDASRDHGEPLWKIARLMAEVGLVSHQSTDLRIFMFEIGVVQWVRLSAKSVKPTPILKKKKKEVGMEIRALRRNGKDGDGCLDGVFD